jgi:hypothetical protein
MGVAGVRPEDEAVALMGLHREGEETFALEHPMRLPERRIEGRHVDEHVRRRHEIGLAGPAPLQERHEFALVQGA